MSQWYFILFPILSHTYLFGDLFKIVAYLHRNKFTPFNLPSRDNIPSHLIILLLVSEFCPICQNEWLLAVGDDERIEGVFNVTVIYSAEKTSLFSFSEK